MLISTVVGKPVRFVTGATTGMKVRSIGSGVFKNDSSL